METTVLPSPDVGLTTASVFQLCWRSRCSTWVRNILNAWPVGPLQSAGMTPFARSTDGSVLAIRVWESTSVSAVFTAAERSVGLGAGAAARRLESRSTRARSRAFLRRSMSGPGRLYPGDHRQGRHREQRDNVLPAADARIQGLEQLHQANRGAQRQHGA